MTYNCIIIDDESHSIGLLKDLIIKLPQLDLQAEFENVADALDYLGQSDASIDIIFSDIEMPELSGIEAVQFYYPFTRYLVFVTAYSDYALDAYKQNVDGFLLKPPSYHELTKLIQSFIKKDKLLITQTKVPEYLFIKGNSKNKFYKIAVEEIVYITSDLNYCWIQTSSERYYTYMSLSKIESLQFSNLLVRVSKSVIVSVRQIASVDGNYVKLNNQEEFSIGRIYRESFFALVSKLSIK